MPGLSGPRGRPASRAGEPRPASGMWGVRQNCRAPEGLQCDVRSGEVLVTAYCEVEPNPPTFLTERSANCCVSPTRGSSRCARSCAGDFLLLKFVLVERRGFEPLTSAVRLRRFPNRPTAPPVGYETRLKLLA